MKEPVTGAMAHLHVIHSSTDQPEASWKLLAYLSSDDYQRGLCQVGLWLPSHTSLLTEEGLNSWITPGVHPEGYRQIASDYLAKHSRIYPYPPGFAEANQLISAALDPVWIGQQTAEQAITADLMQQVTDVTLLAAAAAGVRGASAPHPVGYGGLALHASFALAPLGAPFARWHRPLCRPLRERGRG